MKAKLGWIALLAVALGWLGPVAEIEAEAADGGAKAVWSMAASEETPEGASRSGVEPTAQPTPVPTPEIRAVTIAAEGVKNYTSHTIDAEALGAEGCSLTLPAEGAQILIVHTHTSEAYTMEDGAEYEPSGDWRTLDETRNMIAVGEALKAALERYGLRVVHDTQLHDWPSYSSAYSNSASAIEEYQAAYPSIALVIDLHRDALGNDECIYKTVTDSAAPMAQLMLVVGSDENLPHPNWQENLKLALTLQQAALERCPTLMRPVVLSSCRYNQQLAAGSILLEAGTCGNTLAEAVAAVECFAEVVGPVLAEMVEADA